MFQPKLIRAFNDFHKRLQSKYTLKPYSVSIPVRTRNSFRSISLCVDILDQESNVRIGHLSVDLTRTELYISGFGRDRYTGSLNKRVGVMTGLIRDLLDGLLIAGLKTVSMRDLSNGYWWHLSHYYPSLVWNGLVQVKPYGK